MSYDLVIFDNDGVLVDSEPLANRVLAGYLTELGHPTTYEDSLRDYMGGAVHRVHDTVLARTGHRLPDGFDEELHVRTAEAFRRELQPVPGVADVLAKLAADGVPYCVASSADHARIRVALRTTGLDGYFTDDRIFSAQDVGRGKPAPDLFLHAAAAMGCPPSGCAVVEDSPLGVEAAVAAGMDVYGFTAMARPAALASATATFVDMAGLHALLSG
jgi:HAD superfamily hydrolase (TIGR01509 family)